jgi:hypothetical protein
MVKEEPPANLGTGVNFHSGKEAISMRDETTKEMKLVSPQKMSQTVKPEGMQTRIEQNDLQPASGCWVSGENRADIFSQQSKHSYYPLAKIP